MATVFPQPALTTDDAAEVSRSLQMGADDAAVRQYGPAPLLSGLIRLAGCCDNVAAGTLITAVLAALQGCGP